MKKYLLSFGILCVGLIIVGSGCTDTAIDEVEKGFDKLADIEIEEVLDLGKKEKTVTSGVSCVDTDAGTETKEDPNRNMTKGKTTGLWNYDHSENKILQKPLPSQGTISDRCLDGNSTQKGKLLETYCSADGYATAIVTTCKETYHCQDGACVLEGEKVVQKVDTIENKETTQKKEVDKVGTVCVDTDDNKKTEADPDANMTKGKTTGLWNHDFSENKILQKPLPSEGTISDRCLGDSDSQKGKLLETYCAGNGYATGIVTTCKDGYQCSDGACVTCSGSTCLSCSDSDGGVDSMDSGTITGPSGQGNFITRSDSCINEGGTIYANGEVIVGASSVQEYYCNSNVVSSKEITCEFGCNSGRCMDQKETNSWVQ